jgi:nitrogen-specific signal transduction histidine kinase
MVVIERDLMPGIKIGLKWLDLFLADELKLRHRSQLYRARFMVVALLLSMLPCPLFMTQEYWLAALILPLSAVAFLYRLKRKGAYQYAACGQSLVLLMTAFLGALGQKTLYTGAHFWTPWIIVFVSVMDGPRLGTLLGVLAIVSSLVLLNVHSGYGPVLGAFTSFDELVLHFVVPEFLVLLGVMLIALTFSLLNEQIENDIQRQHITRAQTTHKAAIGQLVGQLAHEVNNPLAIVHAASQQMQIMLRKQQLKPADRKRVLDVIGHALKRLEVVTDGLKAFAGDEDQLPLERAAVQDILHWVRKQIAGFARSRAVTLLWKEEHLQAFILCRPEQIAFILSSLVHDAVEATYHQSDRRVWIQLQRLPTQRIAIQIKDRGPWNSQRGSGPGLSACRKLAQDHGGSLDFQRMHGENIFHLNLPLSISWLGKK